MAKSPNESIKECAGYLTLREKTGWQDESGHRAACHGETVAPIKEW